MWRIFSGIDWIAVDKFQYPKEDKNALDPKFQPFLMELISAAKKNLLHLIKNCRDTTKVCGVIYLLSINLYLYIVPQQCYNFLYF